MKLPALLAPMHLALLHACRRLTAALLQAREAKVAKVPRREAAQEAALEAEIDGARQMRPPALATFLSQTPPLRGTKYGWRGLYQPQRFRLWHLLQMRHLFFSVILPLRETKYGWRGLYQPQRFRPWHFFQM